MSSLEIPTIKPYTHIDLPYKNKYSYILENIRMLYCGDYVLGNYRINLKSASIRLVFIACLILVSFPFSASADVLFGESYHEAIHTY